MEIQIAVAVLLTRCLLLDFCVQKKEEKEGKDYLNTCEGRERERQRKRGWGEKVRERIQGEIGKEEGRKGKDSEERRKRERDRKMGRKGRRIRERVKKGRD